MPEVEGDMYSSSTHVTNSRSAAGADGPLGEDMTSNSSLVDQPLPVLISINRICTSDEPVRMYGGRKSIEAMLEETHEFAGDPSSRSTHPLLWWFSKTRTKFPVSAFQIRMDLSPEAEARRSPARATALTAALWPSRTR